jgi:cytidylate kinase
MRIYFVGAHSTGKTTMARYAAHQYGLPLLTEVARLLLAEKELTLEALRSDMQVANAYQREILEKQFLEERGKEHFVSDRSFDNLAYACSHATVLRQMLKDPCLDEYVAKLRSKDVAVFFIRPAMSVMNNDGVREKVEWEELIRIDAMVKFMLEMWGLRYFQINTPSMQERIRLVDAVLSLMAGGETSG